jgi:hypothetical protein
MLDAAAEPLVRVDAEGDAHTGGAALPRELHGGLKLGARGAELFVKIPSSDGYAEYAGWRRWRSVWVTGTGPDGLSRRTRSEPVGRATGPRFSVWPTGCWGVWPMPRT